MDAETTMSTIATNGVRLHVAEAGPIGGPLVLLLHGFPEFWYGWRHQIGPLAEAGFRVLAPDQRGYNLSDKPRRVADYDLDRLADDVIGLIEATGRDRATVVGHDWGGVVAWWTAIRHPDRLDRLVVLNAPHPGAFTRQIVRHPSQWLKSWYILAFQVPWLPEYLFGRRDGRALVDALRDSGRPGTFPDEAIALYREAWSRPDALWAMIHWYRAMVRRRPLSSSGGRIRAPTLLIWGARDRFLERWMAASSLKSCDQGRLEIIDEATHWVQHEEPERVNRLLLDFLA